MKKLSFFRAAHRLSDCPTDGHPEVVLAGRSNAGKSSLVNALARQKQLARVSQTAGKTQQLVYFDVDQSYYLTDLPGYGFTHDTAARKHFSNLVDQYFLAERPIALVLLLIDVRHEPSDLDRALVQFLQAKGISYMLLANKCDKLSRAQQRLRQQALQRDLGSSAFAMISSKDGQGVEELREAIELAVEQYIALTTSS